MKLVIPNAENEDIDFLETMICLDPNARATASEAVNSDYFLKHPHPAEDLSSCVPLRKLPPASGASVKREKKKKNLLDTIDAVATVLEGYLPNH